MYSFKTREDLAQFIRDELVNTAEVMEILGCSRQNVFDLIKRKKLIPVKQTQRDTLFFRDEIEGRQKPS